MIHNLTIEIGDNLYSANLNEPIDISITLSSDGNGPSCYFSGFPKFEPVIEGDFIGDVSKGGSVNHKIIHLIPHGQGTHTECFGHISTDEKGVISELFSAILTPCMLLSTQPKSVGEDYIIDGLPMEIPKGIEAIAIRTFPNAPEKRNKNYSGGNPPFFAPEVIHQWHALGIKHILTDLPSLDKVNDNGKLAAHNAHFGSTIQNRDQKTITELIYIPTHVSDGLYLLNLQILNIKLDVSPSRPVLYFLKKL